MINANRLPISATPTLLPSDPQQMQTVARSVSINRYVTLDEITLPEFDKAKKISGNIALVFDPPCNYDMILGRDLLQKIGLRLNFATNTME